MSSVIKRLNIIQSENIILIYSLLLLSTIIIEIKSASLLDNTIDKQTIQDTNDDHHLSLIKASELYQHDSKQEKVVKSRSRRQSLDATEASEPNFNDVLRLVEEAVPDGVMNPFRNSKNSGGTLVRATKNQLESFTKLLLQRLRIKNAPNISAYNEKSSIPGVMIKQLEPDQIPSLQKDSSAYVPEDLTTYERVLIPGQQFHNHSCEKRLRDQGFPSNDIQCYQFLKQKSKTAPLPTDQEINSIRLYIKSGYFQNLNQRLIPDMFKIYTIFRPVPNELATYSEKLLNSFEKIKSERISISEVKRVKDWYELTFNKTSLKSIYEILMYVPSGIAISKDLSLPQGEYPSYFEDYINGGSISSGSSSDQEQQQQDDANNDEQEYSPYLYVEYGEKTGKPQHRPRRARNRHTCSSSSPCCRRSLTLDFSYSNSLNFIIYPRILDIGECVGLCNLTSIKASHMKNSPHQNLLVFSETHTGVNHQCCSYSRTGGLELLYATEDKSIVRQFIPNMIVEACRCALPAIISQV